MSYRTWVTVCTGAVCATPTFAVVAERVPVVASVGDATLSHQIESVQQLIAAGDGSVAAIVQPRNILDPWLIHHPGALLQPDTQSPNLATGLAPQRAAVIGSLSQRIMTFAGAGALHQYRFSQSTPLQTLFTPDATLVLASNAFDVNAGGQVLYSTSNGSSILLNRATPDGEATQSAVADNLFPYLPSQASLTASGQTVYATSEPDWRIRSWDSARTPSAQPLYSPPSAPATHELRVHDANDDYALLEWSNTGGRSLFLQSAAGSAGLVDDDAAPRDFLGAITSNGKAAVKFEDNEGQHLIYWNGAQVRELPASPDLDLMHAPPMMTADGEWVVFYGYVDAKPAVLAWAPTSGLGASVIVQEDQTISSLFLPNTLGYEGGGRWMDALSDTGELAIAYRLAGDEDRGYQIAVVQVPEPGMSSLPGALLATLWRRRRRTLRGV